MNLPKSILMLLLLTACKKPSPAKVWLCDGDTGAMVLNGPVKEVFYGDDQYFDKTYFDKKGNMKTFKGRTLDVWEDDSGKHSKIKLLKIQYSALYDYDGNKIALTASYQDDTIHKSKWEFDRAGNVARFIADISASDPPYSDCISPFKYDDKGDLVEYKRIYCTKMGPEIYKYKYDSDHQMVESSLYEEDDLILFKHNYQYLQFDSNHNWTQCKIHTHQYPPMTALDTTSIVTRKITYY